MGQLEDMAMFIRIVDAGGIGKASEQLNLAKSAVSRRLVELEKRLGTRLLNRTTRKTSLTAAGKTYYEQTLKIMDEVAALNAQTSDGETSLNGTLRMTVPLSFGLLHLNAVIDAFAKQHPNLNIQIEFADRQIDLVEEGYELAIRIANLKDSNLQAKRITPIRHVLCAGPGYLKKHGTPKTLTDITEHSFLHYGLSSQGSLKATEPSGKQHQVQLKPKIQTNNGDFLRDMAINDHGITMIPTFIAFQAIAKGDLVPVLTQIQLPMLYAYAVYPQTRFLSQRCRLLIDFIADYFGDEPYWDE